MKQSVDDLLNIGTARGLCDNNQNTLAG